MTAMVLTIVQTSQYFSVWPASSQAVGEGGKKLPEKGLEVDRPKWPDFKGGYSIHAGLQLEHEGFRLIGRQKSLLVPQQSLQRRIS